MRIATHDGTFHADDCMACAILKFVHHNVDIVRTRNPKIYESCDIKVDIGGEYDHDKKIYDHHFKDCPTRPNGFKFAAAGLVWLHYYEKVCEVFSITQKEQQLAIYERVDKEVIQPIDMIDNGEAKDYNRMLSFSNFIASLNINWDEDASVEKAFEQAMEICSLLLKRKLINIRSQLSAVDGVLEAVKNSPERILVLDKFLPWQRILFEKEYHHDFDMIIFPGPNDDWRIQAIPTKPGGMEQDLPLPESWAGLKGDALDKETGIYGCIFVHPARFIGGAKTKDAAIKMAEKAIEIGNKET